MSVPVPLIAGNWKMHGVGASLAEAQAIAAGLDGVTARVALCPPATLLERMTRALGRLKGAGGRPGLPGRGLGRLYRRYLGEHAGRRRGDHDHPRPFRAPDGLCRDGPHWCARKVEAALRAGLEPIICVGETLDERRANITLEVVTMQIRGSMPALLAERDFTVAYEPVWAIGTGLTPTLAQIEETHRAIRGVIVKMFGEEKGASVPILYGGSVNPKNAAEILRTPEVGGALVGGASLKAVDFLQIVRAA